MLSICIQLSGSFLLVIMVLKRKLSDIKSLSVISIDEASTKKRITSYWFETIIYRFGFSYLLAGYILSIDYIEEILSIEYTDHYPLLITIISISSFLFALAFVKCYLIYNIDRVQLMYEQKENGQMWIQ